MSRASRNIRARVRPSGKGSPAASTSACAQPGPEAGFHPTAGLRVHHQGGLRELHRRAEQVVAEGRLELHRAR